MKTSKIERVIAEWQNERTIVEACTDLIAGNMAGEQCHEILVERMKMLDEMIARASTIDEGIENRTPKPTRTRKTRKSTEQSA